MNPAPLARAPQKARPVVFGMAPGLNFASLILSTNGIIGLAAGSRLPQLLLIVVQFGVTERARDACTPRYEPRRTKWAISGDGPWSELDMVSLVSRPAGRAIRQYSGGKCRLKAIFPKDEVHICYTGDEC